VLGATGESLRGFAVGCLLRGAGPRHREATSVGQLDTLGMARPAP